MSSKPIKELKGVNGQLEMYDDKVVIRRKGGIAKLTQGFFKGDKTIYFNQITAIQIKKGGNFINGYIQFTLGGGVESKSGIIKATEDENTVMYRKKDNDLVEEIKEFIEGKRYGPKESSSSVSIADEIKKLKKLVDDGVLSKEEFEEQKKKLLA